MWSVNVGGPGCQDKGTKSAWRRSLVKRLHGRFDCTTARTCFAYSTQLEALVRRPVRSPGGPDLVQQLAGDIQAGNEELRRSTSQDQGSGRHEAGDMGELIKDYRNRLQVRITGYRAV